MDYFINMVVGIDKSWGQTLEYNIQNGFYEGICDLNSGDYQYVYSITGDFDNWVIWGMN